MDMTLLITILVFVVTMVAMLGVFSFLQSRQRAKEWGERLKGQSKTLQTEQTKDGLAYVKQQFIHVLERLGSANKPKDQAETSRLKQHLGMAGHRSPNAPLIFMGAKLFLALLCAGLFLLFGSEFLKGKPPSYFPGGLVISAMIGFYAPQLWLSFATNRRKELLLDGFPDALDLMVVCVDAGLGLDQTIARVGEEIYLGHKDLGDEFQILGLELRAGLTREQALRNLNLRTNIGEIRSLVALLIQTDRFGTSIAQALRVHSDSMRMNRRLRAEEMAAKLPVKMMLPLILCIFPALMVVIMGPGALILMKNVLPAMGGG